MFSLNKIGALVIGIAGAVGLKGASAGKEGDGSADDGKEGSRKGRPKESIGN
jgi:hypothetical protein